MFSTEELHYTISYHLKSTYISFSRKLCNNESGNISGTLGDPGNWIPVISISQEDGQDLINGQGGLPLTVTLVNKPSNYSTMYGTSMAAPHVAGLASLVSSHYPDISYLGIKDRIVRAVDKKSSLEDSCQVSILFPTPVSVLFPTFSGLIWLTRPVIIV